MIANICMANPGINIGAQIGTRLPLWSATGKIFAAFKHDPEAHEWKRNQSKTLPVHKKKELEIDQQTILEDRFVYAAEPLVEHVSSFSVPILNYKKDLIGALTVVGFSTRIPQHPDDPISQYVRQRCLEISYAFGYQPSKEPSE